MTGKNKKENNRVSSSGLGFSSCHLEADRSRGGLSLIMSGIIGVSDFSDEEISLLSHGGRIHVKGERLFICVYEANTIEITGRVREIVFGYGRN